MWILNPKAEISDRKQTGSANSVQILKHMTAVMPSNVETKMTCPLHANLQLKFGNIIRQGIENVPYTFSIREEPTGRNAMAESSTNVTEVNITEISTP
jgi:hypothetical protein